MPRPRKCRRICALPKYRHFIPLAKGCTADTDKVLYMSIDEFETIRLMDYKKYSQEECAALINVARTTVQAMYMSARQKLARCLIEGHLLCIEGGDYEYCPRVYNRQNADKEECIGMKFAVTVKNGEVFQHFGHSTAFKIYTVENGNILSSEEVPTRDQGHGALAGFLNELGIQALICGGIGGGAITALNDSGIKVYGGVSGNADERAAQFAKGRLEYSSHSTCSHHGEKHTCSHHGCAEHS